MVVLRKEMERAAQHLMIKCFHKVFNHVSFLLISSLHDFSFSIIRFRIAIRKSQIILRSCCVFLVQIIRMILAIGYCNLRIYLVGCREGCRVSLMQICKQWSGGRCLWSMSAVPTTPSREWCRPRISILYHLDALMKK